MPKTPEAHASQRNFAVGRHANSIKGAGSPCPRHRKLMLPKEISQLGAMPTRIKVWGRHAQTPKISQLGAMPTRGEMWVAMPNTSREQIKAEHMPGQLRENVLHSSNFDAVGARSQLSNKFISYRKIPVIRHVYSTQVEC